MEHSRDFVLVRLRFRLDSWCVDPQYFPFMWLWYFTFTSTSSNALLQIQHLVEFVYFSIIKKLKL